MTQSGRAVRGSAMTVVQLVVQIALQFAVAPIVLRYAGQEALGAYASVVQLLGYMLALDLGFYVIFIRYLSAEKVRSGIGDRFMRIVATGRSYAVIANLIFAAIIIAFALRAGNWLHLDAQAATDARHGLLLLAAWTFLRIPIAVYGMVLIAVQDLAVRNGIYAAASLVRFGVTVALVAQGWALEGLLVGYVAGDMVEMIGWWLRFRSLHPELRGVRPPMDRALLQEMLILSGSTLLVMLGTRILFWSDNMIVGFVASAAAASIFFTTQTPAVFGWTTINRLTDNAAPGVNELCAGTAPAAARLANAGRVREVYLRIQRYVALLAIPFGLALLVFNEPLVRLWVGPDQYGGHVMTVALACLAVLATLGWVDYVFLVAAGAIRGYARIYFAAAVGKLVLSVVLAHVWDSRGVVLATVPAALVYWIYGHRVIRMQLALASWTMWKTSIAPAALAASVATLALAAITWRWPIATWAQLIAYAALFATLFGAVAWRALPPEDRARAEDGRW